jgi:hypothetical protein
VRRRIEAALEVVYTTGEQYVCERLNLGRIRKDIATQEQPGNPAEHSQLVCRSEESSRLEPLSSSSSEESLLASAKWNK